MSKQNITLSERGKRNLANILRADSMTCCIESVSEDGTEIVLDTGVPGGLALLRTITEAGSVANSKTLYEDIEYDEEAAAEEERKRKLAELEQGKSKIEPDAVDVSSGDSSKMTVNKDAMHDIIRNINNGKWVDGAEPTKEQEEELPRIKGILDGKLGETAKKNLIARLQKLTGNMNTVKDANGKDTQLVQGVSKEKSVEGVVRVPEFFKVEPDDSMWNEMVITEFGIPMVNMGHPAVKKIIQSEDPKQDCKGDLKQFIKAIKANPGLSKVFDTGVLRAIGKMGSLLTLGLAAKTMDAGKRADRIIKELKEKGGVHANRNLLAVKAEDIMSLDPDNEDAVVTVVPYDRSSRKPMESFKVPAASLNMFYAVVDPVGSSKVYIEFINNDVGKALGTGNKLPESAYDITDNSLLEEELFPAEPLVETTSENMGRGVGAAATGAGLVKSGIAGAALGGGALGAGAGLAGAAALAGGAKVGRGLGRAAMAAIGKDDGGYDPSAVHSSSESNTRAIYFGKVKEAYVKKLSEQGHPDFYILKPKSENKEVDIISTAATGYTTGSGKVHMVGMKVGEHEAAAFMKPKLIKSYFSWK